MTNKNENQRRKEGSPLEIHLCKICGMKMNPKDCIIHKDETGHDEFKPVANSLKEDKTTWNKQQ